MLAADPASRCEPSSPIFFGGGQPGICNAVEYIAQFPVLRLESPLGGGSSRDDHTLFGATQPGVMGVHIRACAGRMDAAVVLLPWFCAPTTVCAGLLCGMVLYDPLRAFPPCFLTTSVPPSAGAMKVSSSAPVCS